MVETLGPHLQIRVTMSTFSHVLPALQVGAGAKNGLDPLRAITLIKPFQKHEAEDFDRIEVYR